MIQNPIALGPMIILGIEQHAHKFAFCIVAKGARRRNALFMQAMDKGGGGGGGGLGAPLTLNGDMWSGPLRSRNDFTFF